MNSSTALISEQDLEGLANLMANNPEFAKKLVDAISERLDEKFGHQQGWMSEKMEELSGKIERMDQRFDTLGKNINRRFDNLDRNFGVMGQKQELLERKVARLDRRLDRLEKGAPAPEAKPEYAGD